MVNKIIIQTRKTTYKGSDVNQIMILKKPLIILFFSNFKMPSKFQAPNCFFFGLKVTYICFEKFLESFIKKALLSNYVKYIVDKFGFEIKQIKSI